MARKKTAEEEVQEHILDNTLEEIVADRFARYSKYIIQERALPDARDGLKPVQRRILWAMEEAGNTYNKPYHKSAKTVGNVIGNYHPHGDSSVYVAMVRMSQPWKINLPLIDMQGNNGSIDDDPAAAMRYTECRLAHISDYLLQDIDKETVEWSPNFSDEKLEPTLLPARYPNLLTHGITGIAAGYATNIPPHNLDEVLEATIYRIDHPGCSLDELMQFVKGPDFPTGGIVMGEEGIRQAFETGRGKIYIRSRAEIVQTRTIQQILITEIPYEVVKSQLVRRIDDLRLNNNLYGVLDVRDESGRDGLRIAIDLKKEVPAQEILNYLYKNSDLQVSYTYNMVAIVNQTPRQLGLCEALDAFIEHREIVVRRRSEFDHRKASQRAHVLEGLIRAVSILDEIIALIRASKDKSDSKQKIMDRFGFTDEQAEAIVTMRLYRLSNTDIRQLEQEAAQLEKQIRMLEGILGSRKKLHNLMIRELREVQKEFATPRKTQISRQEASVSVDTMAMIPQESVMVALSRDGYIKRTSLRSYNTSSQSFGTLKENDQPAAAGEASTRDQLLFFTDQGKYGYLPVYAIPDGKWKDMGSHLSSLIRLEGNEKIVSAFVLDTFDKNTDLVLLSARGMIKRVALADFELSRMSKGVTAMNLQDGDSLVRVRPSYGKTEEVFLLSGMGFGTRYPVTDIPLAGPKAKGVKAAGLNRGDQLCDLSCSRLVSRHLLLWQKNGSFRYLNSKDYPRGKRTNKMKLVFAGDLGECFEPGGILQADSLSALPFGNEELKTRTPSSFPLEARMDEWTEVALNEPAQYIPVLQRLESGTWTEETRKPPKEPAEAKPQKPSVQKQNEQGSLFGENDV